MKRYIDIIRHPVFLLEFLSRILSNVRFNCFRKPYTAQSKRMCHQQHMIRRRSGIKSAVLRHKAILTAIENHDALGARHATLVQLDDARTALDVVLGHSH